MAPAATTSKPRTTRAKAPAKATVTQTEAPPKKETEAQKRNRLRNEAEREVLKNHKSEFVEIATRLFAENGLTFTRRLTEKEKAAQAIADQLNQFPELRALFAPVGASYAASAALQAEETEAEAEDLPSVDEKWVEEQARLKQVAAAEGVTFVEAREGE